MYCVSKFRKGQRKRTRRAYKRKRERHLEAKRSFKLIDNTDNTYQKLCPQHRNDLLGVAKRLTGQEHTAEDLVQETMLRAYNFWTQFKQETPDVNKDVRAWLRRILNNIFYSQYAREQKRARSFDAYEKQIDMSEIVEDDSEDVDKVREVLTKLKPAYRELIERHYMQGQSYQEMADGLGIKFTQVQKRLWRARQIMKAELLKAGFINTAPFEPTESVEPEADSIDGVMTGDDPGTFDLTEALPDASTTW